MRSVQLVIAGLAIAGLVACSQDQIALPEGATEAPAATAAVSLRTTPAITALPATRAATAAPLPSVAPVPTLLAAETSGLEQQQRALVELYRRVNPAVVSIEVAGHHPAVEGAPTPDQDIPFAQGSGFLFDDQGHIVT